MLVLDLDAADPAVREVAFWFQEDRAAREALRRLVGEQFRLAADALPRHRVDQAWETERAKLGIEDHRGAGYAKRCYPCPRTRVLPLSPTSPMRFICST